MDPARLKVWLGVLTALVGLLGAGGLGGWYMERGRAEVRDSIQAQHQREILESLDELQVDLQEIREELGNVGIVACESNYESILDCPL